jgi:hypothetical protein
VFTVISAVSARVTPYFTSKPPLDFISLANGTRARRSVVIDETPYGFSSRLSAWAGVSSPSSLPATAICVHPPAYEAGTWLSIELSFFHWTTRRALMPQVCGPAPR